MTRKETDFTRQESSDFAILTRPESEQRATLDEGRIVFGQDIGHKADRESRKDWVARGPKNYRRSDERIKEDAYECLTWQNILDASDIEVEVKGGIIYLKGEVPDRRSRRLAEELVEDVRGAIDVRNELLLRQGEANQGAQDLKSREQDEIDHMKEQVAGGKNRISTTSGTAGGMMSPP